MKSNIFIPQKINVGFQERRDTYTGKLAYIIYYDNRGKLRKENSWQSWRNNKIPNIEFDNIPTEGFVLNKHVGGYCSGWEHRNSYIRVYDPRNFEFEITVENLLYILENTNSIKGKGLSGQFVYGWQGKDLILIPVDSPDYKELSQLNNLRYQNKKFKGKDLIIGGTYLTKDGKELIYMGRYDYHGYKSYKKSYYFYERKAIKDYDWQNGKKVNIKYGDFSNYASIGNLLINCISDKCCEDYADLFDNMEYYETYNPYDESKDEYIEHTVESFTRYIISEYGEDIRTYKDNNWSNQINYCLKYKPKENTSDDMNYFRTTLHNLSYRNNDDYGTNFYIKDNIFKWTIITKIKDENNTNSYSWYRDSYKEIYEENQCTIEEFVKRFKPCWKKEYLKDGKLRRTMYYAK